MTQVTLPEYYRDEAELFARNMMFLDGRRDEAAFDEYFNQYLTEAIDHSLTPHMNDDSPGEVKDHLTWVEMMLQAPASNRKAWVKQMIRGLRWWREKTQKSEKAVWLSDWITSPEFELIGFAPNLQYVKVEGAQEHLSALWVHPWGSPVLAYKHKNLPFIALVGPSIRLNDSVVEEDEGVCGVTG